MEYDQGKDIIARQIYSEKSSAAVCNHMHKLVNCAQLIPQLPCNASNAIFKRKKPTFCQLQVRYLIVFSDSISIWRPTLSVVDEESIAWT